MSQDTRSGTGRDAGIDLTQFYQIFFEEAAENLGSMEQMLLELDVADAADEELNAIFRCAHSVKGGAATFGFADVAALTHQMEALLDKLRRHELVPTSQMVDVLLTAGDALRALLARHQGSADAVLDTTELLVTIRRLCDGGVASALAVAAAVQAAPAPAGPAAASAPVVDAARELELRVQEDAQPGASDSLCELFSEIVGLGQIDALDGGRAADGLRRFKLVTTSSDSDLMDLFTFHVPRDVVTLMPLGLGYGFYSGAPGAPADQAMADPGPQACGATAADPGFGFFDDNPGAPAAARPGQPQGAPEAKAAGAARPTAASARAEPKSASTLDSATLRVSVDKVDQLINLMGELVITQAMLAQKSLGLDASAHQQLSAGLANLERNTRDLQEAVMSIRMIPMAMVFNRFPRMLRDLAGKLGKKVELVTQGESTELDKGMVEKITDPLTHLVRNSCDHGIEPPDERRARGKPETGTLTLVASHQGGSIVIEVRDDGKGLSRQKLLAKAREKGMDAPDTMSDTEVWNLVFAPGFSTAEEVTDVSGRGVGMDVVRKNILSLGGTVDIDSAEGYGMSVKVRLPLTMAIMDGMSVGVGHEVYILPLGSVVESFQVKPAMLKTIGGSGRVVDVRGEFLPVVDLSHNFQVPRPVDSGEPDIMVVVEAEGARLALLVHELLGQQQVVVKNLEANYRKVDDVSGATIMGDGRVALILDIGALVRHPRR